jgi:transposase
MDRGKVERQVGRLLERNARAGRAFEIRVEDTAEAASGLKVTWTMDPQWAAWAQLTEGHYLLRTNLVGWTPAALWQTYIQLTQAEAAFRVHKSDLAIRPIWHQQEKRVQAHILFSFLAFALWKTLEQWMKRSELGSAPRPLREEMARLKVAEVRLPTSTGREVSLQCVTQPDPAQQQLIARLGLKLPQRLGQPRWVEAVPPAPFRLKM